MRVNISYSFALIVSTMAWPGLATETVAQNAPAGLRGKSIIAGWTENRMQRAEGGRRGFRPISIPQTLTVYVSGEGRTFERRSIGGASKEGVGGGAITGQAGRTVFRGNSLIVAGATRGGGARVVTISFESGFSTCSVRVQVGRESGADIIKGTSIRTGQKLEYTMQGVTGESCRIQSGNVFAQ